jgi:hypothetical protein
MEMGTLEKCSLASQIQLLLILKPKKAYSGSARENTEFARESSTEGQNHGASCG